MSIMQSCCCWRSVRRGSFACAIYTMLYYSVIAMTIATVLQEEGQYLSGNRSLPKSNSVLESEVSPVTMRFNITLLICSSCGVVCCLLLLYGLFKEEKLLLVPWIIIVIICSFVDISHLIYLFFFVSLAFNPITAMVLTIDFFLLCLNVYSVLCVISQYQEYATGHGTASDDCEQRIPAIRYTVHPTTTATSCQSSRRTQVNNEIWITPTTTTTTTTMMMTKMTKMRTTTTMTTTTTYSPITFSKQLRVEVSSSNDKPNRKHVQFPHSTSSSLVNNRTDVNKYAKI